MRINKILDEVCRTPARTCAAQSTRSARDVKDSTDEARSVCLHVGWKKKEILNYSRITVNIKFLWGKGLTSKWQNFKTWSQKETALQQRMHVALTKNWSQPQHSHISCFALSVIQCPLLASPALTHIHIQAHLNK